MYVSFSDVLALHIVFSCRGTSPCPSVKISRICFPCMSGIHLLGWGVWTQAWFEDGFVTTCGVHPMLRAVSRVRCPCSEARGSCIWKLLFYQSLLLSWNHRVREETLSMHGLEDTEMAFWEGSSRVLNHAVYRRVA